jgi:tetratricopeptide (TPR) repeat protein
MVDQYQNGVIKKILVICIFGRWLQAVRMKIKSLIIYLKNVPNIIRRISEIRREYYNQNFLESIDLCNQLNESFPYNMDGFYFKGLNLIKLKLYDEARENFEIARTNFNKNKFKKFLPEQFHDISIGICRTYLGKRMIAEALNEINHIIDLLPKSARGYLMKAQIYSAGNDYISAIESLNIGLKFNKRDKELVDYKNRLTYIYTVKVNEDRN